MASEKPTMILMSKSDMSKEQIEVLSDSDAWKIIYSMRSRKAQDNRLQVCFTGFSTSRKNELSAIAESHNFKVVSSVTKNLDFLCGGENAGPKKIEKAELQGVQFLNETQFLNLAETGEVPNS
jgi:NAD-dependent DNA ligase